MSNTGDRFIKREQMILAVLEGLAANKEIKTSYGLLERILFVLVSDPEKFASDEERDTAFVCFTVVTAVLHLKLKDVDKDTLVAELKASMGTFLRDRIEERERAGT